MSVLEYNGFTVTVIRSRRKTLAIQIKDGHVIARVPQRLDLQQVHHFIVQKSSWIKHKLAAHIPLLAKKFVAGESYLYLGEDYQLRLKATATTPYIAIESSNITLYTPQQDLPADKIRQTLINFYKQEAELLLTQRAEQLAQTTGMIPESITIKSYRARWGSCTLSGHIQLNWALIMAPAWISDYVIIHELCHLQQHNHSPAFWQLVAQHAAEWSQARNWLKQYGATLSL